MNLLDAVEISTETIFYESTRFIHIKYEDRIIKLHKNLIRIDNKTIYIPIELAIKLRLNKIKHKEIK